MNPSMDSFRLDPPGTCPGGLAHPMTYVIECAGASMPRTGSSDSVRSSLHVHDLGQVDYVPCLAAMQAFTRERVANTPDELWLLEHPPVFTQGLAGKAEHVLSPGDIPVVQVDRGGQVTYHAPGQLVAYLLFDLQRAGLGVRALVDALESAVIELLARYEIQAEAQRDAPGVYVAGRKIASLGLKIRQGRCYHGLALNVDMDMQPFSRINPCGYAGLAMCQVSDFLPLAVSDLKQPLAQSLASQLSAHLFYQ